MLYFEIGMDKHAPYVLLSGSEISCRNVGVRRGMYV